MKVKTYSASSMTEAMKKVREELGSDAVILSSKPIFSRGFLGLFKKRHIEVIAAIDTSVSHAPPVKKEKQKKVPERARMSSNIPVAQRDEKPVQTQAVVDIQAELAELKNLVKNLNHSGEINYPESLRLLNQFLEEQEVEPSIRHETLAAILEKWYTYHGEPATEQVKSWLEDRLIEKMNEITPWGFNFTKKYINIVGPTGVGKTTTLAKAAAELIVKQNKQVAFITTDTYRIAAIDQLKTYAQILNVPIEVAYNMEDFKKATERFSHYDAVLIDTAGRNFRNAEYVKDLQNIIDFSNEMETYLVLSLTSKQKDMEDIYHQFSLIPIKQTIFTKVDETSTYGSMLNFTLKNKIGVALLTNGQNVPDDIVIASPQKVIQMVLEVQK
jgi:flagellar biosynthesis protein FlhF